jgi:nitrogen fixation/metabolism regulation signal transduction histidine kinase
MSEFPRSRVGLQIKIVAGLLVVAAVPLLVSAVLIDQISVVAQNFSSNEADRLRPPLVKAETAYRDLVKARKEIYRQVGKRITAHLRAQPLWEEPLDKAAVNRALGRLLNEEDLARVAVLADDGRILSFAVSALLPGSPTGRWRDFAVKEPLPGGRALEMTFVTRVDFLDDLKELGLVLSERRDIAAFRKSLPRSYRTAFLILVGGVVVIVTTAGILFARRITRRIEILAVGTRDVAAGNLAARVELPGRDELAELSQAFNLMVAQLDRDRQQIVYLQKMSTWQDVARRLAHEIKNPLTPIQLAVQQAVSTYDGEDPKFKKTLGDAQEIVEEEIAGLRRLVDAFRSLGRLPQANPTPIDLSLVVQDLARDPEIQDNMVINEPRGEPVTVRGDRLLLRRVLANLVENGMHAGDGGVVHVTWRRDGDTAVVTVDDAGSGVPAEKRDSIFDPYCTTKEHGTGLGLAIAKKIALEHRGSLELAAEASPLGGARFVLTLPLSAADVEEPPASA